jgi:hypothetical protein
VRQKRQQQLIRMFKSGIIDIAKLPADEKNSCGNKLKKQ